MIKELQYPFDSNYILTKKKSLRRQLLADGSERFSKRIAVLGGSTTSDIVRILELFLLNYGIEPVFYECEYAQYEQEALFPGEELLSFHPDVIFLHTSNRNIRQWPEMTDSKDAVEEKFHSELSRFTAIWEHLRETFHCPLIQNNFEPPFYRLLGNRDAYDFRGRTSYINKLNAAFAEYALEHDDFHLHDLHYLAADYGLREWSNPYYWNMYKYCMCFDAIPAFAFSAANLIKALFGRNKKALALDLDNTLWGGVIGDDGVTGIEIGQENGTAQSYYEFQQYIRQMKPLGILLTVCSKNEEANAMEGLNHPEGVLRPEDFVVIKANWDNKDRNIAQIASDLNILPESIVFVDDNPAERGIVEAQLPGVIAPVMDSVENYILTLDRNGFFETVSFNEDDLKRNEMYRENALRAAAQATFSDYGEYLASLQMEAEIGDFLPVYLPRITQLTNKSNQFNLTTRRYTVEEMEAIYQSPDYIRLYGKLIDKFGDNGVVSVVIGRIDHAADAADRDASDSTDGTGRDTFHTAGSTGQDTRNCAGIARPGTANMEGTSSQNTASMEGTAHQDIANMEGTSGQNITNMEGTSGQNITADAGAAASSARILHIELWLMSCRVLKRDMEQAMLDELVERCQTAGIKTIRGYYYPTKKNAMVKDLYGTFGFCKIAEDDQGNTIWELPVAGYQKQNRCIRIQEHD